MIATRGWTAVVIAGVLLAAALPLVARQAPQKSMVRYGLTTPVIAEANPADALAASLVWAREIAGQVGVWDGADAVLFQTVDEAVPVVNAGNTDVLALTTLEYLAVERRLAATPVMTFETLGDATVEYVLLVRNDVRTIHDVAGKRLTVYAPARAMDLSNVWLDVLAAEAGLEWDGHVFVSARTTTKKGQAVMALFFKQTDVAVESAAAFAAAVELNPQIARDVKILARSPKLLPGLVCIRNGMSPDLRDRYVQKAIHLHELPQFRQTFLVMRVTKLSVFDPRSLDSARALVARRQALKSKKRLVR